jgi:hypothetical protein
MAKRSGRDRNRDAARSGNHNGGRGNRANRKLARELGATSRQLDKARSVESKRLRQLDEAAAEVARLEGELRRIEAELAGAGGGAGAAAGAGAAVTPPPAPATPSAPRRPAPSPGRVAPPALAVPEPALPAEPEPSESPREAETSATAASAPAFAPPSTTAAPRAAKRGRAAQAASLEEELARLDAAREGDLRGTTLEETELEPEPAREPARDADAPGAPHADDDDALVIRLGAGASPMLDADVSEVVPGFVAEAPIERTEEEEGGDPGGWTAGSGLPFRAGRNGSTAPADHEASDAAPSISPESERGEAVEAPDPTARSWPQRRQQRARS